MNKYDADWWESWWEEWEDIELSEDDVPTLEEKQHGFLSIVAEWEPHMGGRGAT